MAATPIEIIELGLCDYEPVWHAMRAYTDCRTAQSPDRIWLVEHHPVFTQGQNGKPEHILNLGDIPLIPVDRGGQVTYHGPGQIVLYPLIDLQRRHLGVRHLVSILEAAMIAVLDDLNIPAYSDPKAPGVYVDGAKIGSVGLRVRRGASFHGLSFNVAMDLEPFSRINPCGIANLPVTQVANFIPHVDKAVLCAKLTGYVVHYINQKTSELAPMPEAPGSRFESL